MKNIVWMANHLLFTTGGPVRVHSLLRPGSKTMPAKSLCLQLRDHGHLKATNGFHNLSPLHLDSSSRSCSVLAMHRCGWKAAPHGHHLHIRASAQSPSSVQLTSRTLRPQPARTATSHIHLNSQHRHSCTSAAHRYMSAHASSSATEYIDSNATSSPLLVVNEPAACGNASGALQAQHLRTSHNLMAASEAVAARSNQRIPWRDYTAIAQDEVHVWWVNVAQVRADANFKGTQLFRAVSLY